MWDIDPLTGIEPTPPASGAQSLRSWTTREASYTFTLSTNYLRWLQEHTGYTRTEKDSEMQLTAECLPVRSPRASLSVQWLRLRASKAGDTGLIPGQGTKIPYALRSARKKREHKKSLLSSEQKPRKRA